ncbi:MAG: flagellar assembly protein FliW [Phycisphaeraceae bacterium]|nr:flagellar assembly protein FliW [Phycisphaeraceae bacterium]
MILQTTRFGAVEVDEGRLIDFPGGLLGFANARRFALLQPDARGVFFWLQSTENPDLAFVVTDPALWADDFAAPLRPEQVSEIGLNDPSEAQTFVIVNRRGAVLTANMQGPLVISAVTRRGVQVVLAERRWSTRHELVRLEGAQVVGA